MAGIFKGLIWCECGKKYNYRLDHSIPTYLCGARKNYGVKVCGSQTIKEEDLLHLTKNHKIEDIKKIIVSKHGFITVYYHDDTIGKWDSNQIIY